MTIQPFKTLMKKLLEVLQVLLSVKLKFIRIHSILSYSIEFLREEMMSGPSNYHREYSPYGSYSLFQFKESDLISVLKNSVEYSFVFFKCLS